MIQTAKKLGSWYLSWHEQLFIVMSALAIVLIFVVDGVAEAESLGSVLLMAFGMLYLIHQLGYFLDWCLQRSEDSSI